MAIILINKPAGWTSFDVVAKIRGTLRKQIEIRNSKFHGAEPCEVENKSSQKIRVGHAGTLDPFATGLLIVLTGDDTKRQDSFMKQDKEYIALLHLGATSSTGDPEGDINQIPNTTCLPARQDYQIPNRKQIESILSQFIGEIEQTPPQYSAIKIGGRPAYKYAREGKKVDLKSRKVKIHDISIIDYKWPLLNLQVSCSSGTYIRTLGEDIGQLIGCGAYVEKLQRTKIGEYRLNSSLSPDEVVRDIISGKV